jgi:hypothetical protein
VSDPFAAAWENATLGRSITHREHVRISWGLLREHGRAEGERRIVAGTERNCDAAGAGDRFDEPLTRRWVDVIADALAKTPGADFDAFLAANPELERSDLVGEPLWRAPEHRESAEPPATGR